MKFKLETRERAGRVTLCLPIRLLDLVISLPQSFNQFPLREHQCFRGALDLGRNLKLRAKN